MIVLADDAGAAMRVGMRAPASASLDKIGVASVVRRMVPRDRMGWVGMGGGMHPVGRSAISAEGGD